MPPSTDRTIDLNTEDWTILRILARNRESGVVGRVLRCRPTRKNKDGDFLSDLVNRGLISLVAGIPGEWRTSVYKPTPVGLYAAEYGSYLATRAGVALDIQNQLAQPY